MSEQPSTPNKKRSCIYDFYTEDDVVEYKYICNLCQLGVLAKGRTSNLIAHLQVTNHEEVYKKYLDANVEKQNSVSLVKSMSKKRKIGARKKAFYLVLIRTLSTDQCTNQGTNYI